MAAGKIAVQANDTRVYTITPEEGAVGNVSITLPKEGGTVLTTSTAVPVDAVPTNGSTHPVSSDGVFDALAAKLDVSSYTANDVLTKIKTVDGTGSGLDADLLDGKDSSTAALINTVAVRDSAGDITARLFRSNYAEQTAAAPATADIAFRVDKDVDNYIRFMDATAFKEWLTQIGATGAPMFIQASDTARVSGKTGAFPNQVSVRFPFFLAPATGTVRVKITGYAPISGAGLFIYGVPGANYDFNYDSTVTSAEVVRTNSLVNVYLPATSATSTYDIPVVAGVTYFFDHPAGSGTTYTISAISICFDFTATAPTIFAPLTEL